MSVMLYPCMLCVALLMCLFVLCVACLTMCLSVVAILLYVCISFRSLRAGSQVFALLMLFL